MFILLIYRLQVVALGAQFHLLLRLALLHSTFYLLKLVFNLGLLLAVSGLSEEHAARSLPTFRGHSRLLARPEVVLVVGALFRCSTIHGRLHRRLELLAT